MCLRGETYTMWFSVCVLVFAGHILLPIAQRSGFLLQKVHTKRPNKAR